MKGFLDPDLCIVFGDTYAIGNYASEMQEVVGYAEEVVVSSKRDDNGGDNGDGGSGYARGACRIHRNPELGRIAAENLFQLDPKDSGNFVVLSNSLAAAGRWEEATNVRKEIKDIGLKKGTGCSWIAVKNEVHIFQAKDTFHERNSEIHATLLELKRDMEEAGYIADPTYALYDLEEE
ncbi:pentatricopeptide repeat-containing protein At4g14850-like [Eucalyptus grandis]|uniref:pentatricopeptide repeat-containing protein At4g14850-like n=1 Tax=Eucalyptus grandis TaxID=71139 RepID=UPI00192F0BA2|nr:pentatricopeptide repeat-containing protein At4g14850-like [Eucalyptus grandis]